jgi:hypothetical protein
MCHQCLVSMCLPYFNQFWDAMSLPCVNQLWFFMCHGKIGFHVDHSHWLMVSLGISLKNSLSVGRMWTREGSIGG